MKKEYSNIEDLFKQSFDGYRVEPPETLWNRINLRLNLKQFFKADFRTLNIYYSSVIIGLITTLAIILFNTNKDYPAIANKSDIKIVENSIISNHEVNNENILSPIKKQENKIVEKKPIKNPKVIISKQISFSAVSDSFATLPITLIKNFNQVALMNIDSAGKIKSISALAPKPLFTIDCKEGCAPFELKLNNFSENATDYRWTFGDGGISNDKSPVYTYLYPGVFKIHLKVTGIGGVAYSIIDSIIVHDKPNIKAYWPYQSNFMVGEKVIIPVDAQNAKRFEWDFGDGNIVRQKQGEYSYKSAGVYTIILRTWSDKNCYDSVKIADATVVNSDKKIVFPNAFCPNPDGPSGGKYYDRETHFDIFHPLLKGKLSEYKLIVYSKSGGKVFESNDVKIGWDGYFENRIMPEGVYLFIASGKFEGGESFLQKGNITIIHR